MDSGKRRKRGRSFSPSSRSPSPGNFKRRHSPDRRDRSPGGRHGRDIDAFGRQTDREHRGGRYSERSPPRRRRRYVRRSRLTVSTVMDRFAACVCSSRSRGSYSPDRRDRSPRRRDRSPGRKGGGKGGKGELSIDDRIQQEARKFFDEHKEEEWFLERCAVRLQYQVRALQL